MAPKQVTSPRPLRVSIVGAGLGGLTAAIALRKCGHNVQVFESSERNTEFGAGITLPANALRILHQLGFHTTNLQSVELDGVVRLDAQAGSGTSNSPGVHSDENSERFRYISCHRNDLRNELERLATAEEGQGTPAQLHLGSKVVACDPESGSITLVDGETVAADLIVGADGIHSTMRSSIVGQVVQPLPSGLSCFRFFLDASGIKDIPDLGWYTDKAQMHAIDWLVTESQPFRRIFTYPVRNGTLINFIGFFADEDHGLVDWVPAATRQDVLDKYHDAHPKFLRLMELPLVSAISKWKLRTVPILGTWIRGHAALLGDSAHATLPFMGQGLAVAIEDAGVLGTLLPLGTTKDEVPVRLAAYERLRNGFNHFHYISAIVLSLQEDHQTNGLLRYLRWDRLKAS
ncbi:FAD/NAD(P)-binding domain-containing protein [Roridomyces roridus]|uniref:FAD/NAD(P)-binding domain-containing protein n=1 Tax=Roridomyces roridus TaxID=1738132 RepID=A0AAD7FSH5_9AGAR|nr:FAD/NAD(P)-binding domain-containing protein [Roridomyces roridus]